jgi:hypothetical protein
MEFSHYADADDDDSGQQIRYGGDDVPIGEVYPQDGSLSDDAPQEVYVAPQPEVLADDNPDPVIDAAMPPNAEPVGSIFIEQRHSLEDGTIVRENPSPGARLVIREQAEALDAKQREVDALLSFTGNQNEQYAAAVSVIERQFQADFPSLTGRSVHLLTPDNFERFKIAGQGLAHPEAASTGMFEHNNILLAADPQVIARQGLGWIIGVGLHENFHASAENERFVFTSEAGDPVIQGIRILGYTDTVHPDGRRGQFLEESSADSYRVSRMRTLGISVELPETVDSILSELLPGSGQNIVFAQNDGRPPQIDDETGGVVLPVAYLGGGKIDPITRVLDAHAPDFRIAKTTSSLPAYSLDLLDRETNGQLLNAVLEGRTNPEAAHEIPRHINAFEPGLFRELYGLRYSVADFYDGLLRIHQVLGVAGASQALARHRDRHRTA